MAKFKDIFSKVGNTVKRSACELRNNFNSFDFKEFCSSKIVKPLNKIINDFKNSKDR